MRNEAANVPQFYRELRSVLQRMGRPYEIIVDRRRQPGRDVRAAGEPLRRRPDPVVIRFRRNFGQTAAFCGRLRACPRPPHRHHRRRPAERSADIPAMVDLAERETPTSWRLAEGSEGRVHQPPAAVDDRQLGDLAATGVTLHDYGCSLKVFRAEVVKPMKLYGEMHRFLPAIASEFGVTHRASYVVNHRPRLHGNSKYGISRTIASCSTC
jgi:hypothetical protein